MLNLHRQTCFNVANVPRSGAWLNALSSTPVCTLLDGDSLRIALSHRMCRPYKCRCGATIDELASHPLSCRFSAGRNSRHSAMNDVVQRALNAAGFPSQHEPMGVDRGGGIRPDGLPYSPSLEADSRFGTSPATIHGPRQALFRLLCNQEPARKKPIKENYKILGPA